jgi:hypothetical protein
MHHDQRPFAILPLTFGLVLGASGCSSEDTGPQRPPIDARYLALTRVDAGPDATSGLLFALESLESGAAPDAAYARELPGGGTLAAIRGKRAAIFMPFEEPTVTRFDVNDVGEIVEGAKVSGASLGVTSFSFVAQTAPDEIWLHARPQMAIVRLDPLKMGLEAPVQLGIELGSFADSWLDPAVVVAGKIVIPSVGVDWTNDAFRKGTTLAVFDPATRTSVVITDTRCTGGVVRPSSGGTIYAGTEIFSASAHIRSRPGTDAPCVLKLNADATGFDASYAKPFTAWTGSSPAGELIPTGPDSAWVRVYDPSLGPAAPEFSYEVAYSNAWRWGRVNPNGDAPVTLLDRAPGFGRVDLHRVKDELWTFEYRGEELEGTSQLVQIGADELSEGISMVGFLDGIVALDQ